MLTFSLHAPPPFYCLLVQAVKSAIDVQAAAALKTLPIEEKVCLHFFDFFWGGVERCTPFMTPWHVCVGMGGCV